MKYCDMTPAQKERAKAATAAWLRAHPEKSVEYSRVYREKHRDEIKKKNTEYQRTYREKHRDEYNRRHREWYNTHKDRHREYRRRHKDGQEEA